MALYTTSTAVISMIPADIITELTDDSNVDEIGVDAVNYCITLGSDLIDGYLMGHYALPLDPAKPYPPLIVDIATKLTIYFLYQRSLMMTMPEPLTKQYEWCLQTLRAIQKGQINPFPVVQSPFYARATSNANQTTVPQSVILTRDWSGYYL